MTEETIKTEALMSEKRVFNPPKKIAENANIVDWEAALKRGEEDLEGFWEDAAKELEWFGKWDKVLDDSGKPFYKWFTGAKCNIVHNALDRHIKTPLKGKVAIIAEAEDGKVRKFTYAQLHKEVCKFANVLKSLGIKKGDRVAIYMPNIPEIAIAMLATVKIGAIHSVVFAGYGEGALKIRIEDAEAKIIVCADGVGRGGKKINLKDTVDKAVAQCPAIKKTIVVKNAGLDVDMANCAWYHELMETASDKCETERMDSEDILYILYTSGTTGKPKGVIHVHGGYMVGVNRTLRWVFDIKPQDIFWCAADPGWVTGHSYIVYGPLLAGTTTLMYEGHPTYPDPGRMWDIIERHSVTILYTAPTMIRMLMGLGDEWPKKHDLNTLRLLGSVGEPINPEAWMWYYKNVGGERCPIMDTWWQTETGMFMLTPTPQTPLKPGSATKPFPGVQAKIVDNDGKEVETGKGGHLAITTPWPAMLRTVYKNPERYKKTYWQEVPGGMYISGDIARKDEDGYFWVQGRSDDVLKIAGHRIGTAEIESAFVSHKAVAEAAVIGIPDEVKGETGKAFVILKKGFAGNAELVEDLKKHVRKELGPLAIIDSIEFVGSLPKTRSGKIMRRVLKARELGLDEGDTSALVD